uniref:Cytochrome c oxidase polypeptide VIa n=1 Tax=Rhabditophanes sp. KR3021 TaxID=114890 RepID=A0AC35TZF3_9BILA
MATSRLLTLAPKVATRTAVRPSSGPFYGSWEFNNYKKSLIAPMKPAFNVQATWKKMFLAAAVPCMILTAWVAWNDHAKHHAKPRRDFVEYSYLNTRNKPFPWGDGNKSLFHNPEEQWVPGVGFEKERHH